MRSSDWRSDLCSSDLRCTVSYQLAQSREDGCEGHEATRRFPSKSRISYAGWGGRIRTGACRYQKPVPSRLATPQQPVRRSLYSAATPIARRARSKTRYPAVGVGGAAALDVDELALEHFGDLARPAGADREARVSARHLAHRGHDSG